MSGKLLIFSAPSGSGKTTLVNHLLQNIPTLGFSISATTRKPREDKELNGKDYYFYSQETFEAKIANHEFAEWEEVYKGTYYGTLKSEIDSLWAEGKDVVFDVDVIGGLKLKKTYGEKALAVYVDIPDFEDLEARLRRRATESEEKIQQRLAKARSEREYRSQFDTILMNANLEISLKETLELATNFLKK